VLFTAQHAQLVVMCLQPGEEIGDEVHLKVDQFFRIEQGKAKFVFNEKEEHLVHDGDAVVVTAGDVPQRGEYVEDGYAEALYDLLSAEPPGRDSAQEAEAEAAELVEHH
jgi:quercetin dioxygenase-like cupin family protein